MGNLIVLLVVALIIGGSLLKLFKGKTKGCSGSCGSCSGCSSSNLIVIKK